METAVESREVNVIAGSLAAISHNGPLTIYFRRVENKQEEELNS